MTPGPSSTQQSSTASSNQNQTAATGNYGTVASNNSQLNGAVTATPYYQNEVQAGANATTQGYNNANTNLKQSMEAAGVQGNSGMSAGAQTALAAREAGDLGQVKTNAYSDTEKQQLAANSQDLEAAGQQTGAGVQYANQANQDEMAEQQQGWANESALGQALLGAATGGVSAIPGLNPIAKGAARGL